MTQTFESTLRLPVTRRQAFDWHARPGAFDRLAPPWQNLEIVRRNQELTDGSVLVFRVKQGPVAITWRARHENVRPGELFVDVQESGPFAHWRHKHRFEEDPASEDGSLLVDRVRYRLPLGPLGAAVAGGRIRSDLRGLFAYRRHVTLNDLELHARLGAKPLHVAVTGASGLLGTALCALLTTGGHRVTRIVRRDVLNSDEVQWTDGSGFRQPERLEGLDGFIDLAGENIAGGPWSAERRRRIEASRRGRVLQVVDALAGLDAPPAAYLCASGVGIYGNADGTVDEGSPIRPDDGFLAGVAARWEAAAQKAEEFGARVTRLRYGVVLSPKGGALEKLVGPVKAAVGTVPGSGKQAVPWISLDDAVAATVHALVKEVEGPVNVVAPEAVTLGDLVGELGEVLHRPTPFRVPGSLLKLVLGEMAEETVLQGLRARPGRLHHTGFVFRDVDLRSALGLMLGKGR